MVVARSVRIPLDEIELRASRSSGPTASRIEAVFDVAASTSLTPEQKSRIQARCGPRVTATAQDARSQARNRELALRRLRDRLASALHVPRARRATKPSAAARTRRLESKRRQSAKKQARRRPAED